MESHQKAKKAQDIGRFRFEIVDIPTKYKDPKTGETVENRVDMDDGIRISTME